MPTLQEVISAPNDDGYEHIAGGAWFGTEPVAAAGLDNSAAFRFASVDFDPESNTFLNSALIFPSTFVPPGFGNIGYLRGVKSANVGSFSDLYRPYSHAPGTDTYRVIIAYALEQTPARFDVTLPTQEIFSDTYWSEGNALAFKIEPPASWRGYIYTYDRSLLDAAILEIEFLEGAVDLIETVGSGVDDGTINGGLWFANDFAFMVAQGMYGPYDMTMGVRFQQLDIPQGATVTGAALKLGQLFSVSPGNNIGRLYAEASDDAVQWVDLQPPPSFSRTTAHTDLTAEADNSFLFLDVKEQVQEIVDRSGWEPNNALRFVGGGTASGVALFASYEFSPEAAATLFVVFDESGPSGHTLTAESGTYTLTGQGAVLSRTGGIALEAAPGVYTITGRDAGLERGLMIPAEAGSYSIAGAAASFTRERTITAARGTYAITGIDAALVHDREALAAETGAYILTGVTAKLSYERPALAADTGTYALTGAAVSVRYDRAILAEGGAYTLTGYPSTPTQDYVVGGTAGTYTLTGVAATFSRDYVAAAGQGSYLLTGMAVDFSGDKSMPAEAGEYAVTGVDAGLRYDRAALAAEAGSYALTGTAAGVYVGYAVSAEAGTFTITGVAAGLTADRLLAGGAGSYVMTGQDATLTKVGIFVLQAFAGAYSLAGQAAVLEAERHVEAAAGSYALSGKAAEFVRAALLPASAGSYSLTGQDVGLSKTPGIRAEAGLYELIGQFAILTYTPLPEEKLPGGADWVPSRRPVRRTKKRLQKPAPQPHKPAPKQAPSRKPKKEEPRIEPRPIATLWESVVPPTIPVPPAPPIDIDPYLQPTAVERALAEMVAQDVVASLREYFEEMQDEMDILAFLLRVDEDPEEVPPEEVFADDALALLQRLQLERNAIIEAQARPEVNVEMLLALANQLRAERNRQYISI